MNLGLSPLPIKADSELLQLYRTWNNTTVDFPTHRCIAEVVQQQAFSNPHAIAAVFRNQKITYEDLNKSANSLAWFLIERGVGPSEPVCIFAKRSINFLTSVLGIFKAGSAYVPLDPLSPPARLHSVLEQSKSQFIITTQSEFAALTNSLDEMDGRARPQVFLIEECLNQELQVEDPPIRSTPNDLVYVIFTSGSTGLPKGAMVEQKGMMNHLYAKIKDLNLTASDRIVQNASQCFDISVWQFLAGLLVGGQIHIVDEDVTHNTEVLLGYLESNRITIFEVVPSMLRGILDLIESSRNDAPHLSALRWMILTGEALPPRYCAEWLGLYPHIPMLNAYGPTECSDDVTHYPINEAPAEDVVHMPIGYPVANMQLYVVEQQGEEFALCPVGASGELCVTGLGVGRGYINDAQRTKAAFFKDPFSENSDARLYRTGDLARYLPDGRIEFLGRLDSQVKIRGFRIELGEIESILLRHEVVKECAVIVRSARQMQGKLVARECLANVEVEANTSERKRLLAYLVCREEISTLALRGFLQQYLPPYMIPEQFTRLDALPLNANGKVDKNNLPGPENVRPDLGQPFVRPRSELEAVIASIWQDQLDVDRIGVDDSFFGLGGDSLLAIQVLNRLRQATGANIAYRNFFEAGTVAGLARIIEQTEKDSSLPLPITGHAHGERCPLSLAQQRLWFLWKLEPDNPYYTFQGILNVKGELNLPVFRRAWQTIWKRHEILRARFGVEDGRPFQLFDDGEDFDPLFISLAHLPEARRHQAVRNRARSEAERAFDLEDGKLFRIQLFKFSDTEHVALLTMHEIILDGWATCVMIRELGELYDGFIKGVESPLSDRMIKFSDFVLWESENLQRSALQRQEDYWREKLAGDLPVLDLVTDRPRPMSPTFLGRSHGIILDARLSNEIHKLSRQESTTLFVVILAAFYETLHRYTGQDDLIIGAPLANRSHKDTEDIVGFFLNMLAFRTDLSGDPTFIDLIARVRDTVTDGITNSDYPFIWLLETVSAIRNPSIAPVFQVMLNMLSFPQVTLQYDNLEMGFRELETGYTKYDLSLYAQEQGDRVYLQLSYLKDLFEDETADRVLSNMVAFLNSAVANPAARMSHLEVMTESEKKALLIDFNNTARDFDDGRCIHELFELQAEETPSQTALIFNGRRLNYGDLNARANQLAHYLRRRGIGPEIGVAVCVQRSFDTIITLLGIIKAGGYYVALDPDYPRLRLNKMLEDTAAPVLLLHKNTDQFENYGGEKIYLDDWAIQLEKEDIFNTPCLSTPNNMLNMVYTSSTTGNPKGAFITIKSVLNRLFWMWEAYPFQPDDVAVLQKSIALVAATWECFGALLKGIPTLILSREALLDPQELWSKLVAERVSYLLASPALLQGVIDQAELHPSEWTTLKLATTSAETISVAMATQWNRLFPQAPLLNLYGSTECSSNVTAYNTGQMSSGVARVMVGKPLANTRVYILDEQLALVPIGGKGEMCVSGECLARGYLNLPELTAERFIPGPFFDRPGSRLYRTGDLARYCADGNIELLGRKDNQIKIRGFRVELDDVEVAILRHPKVKQCAVRVYQDQAGRNRLASYLVAEDGMSPSTIRGFLRERLPEYMIPSDFIMVGALPLTPAGKIDRRALPLPDRTRPDLEATFVAPRTDTEKLIARIWSDILGIEQVGIYDNFFELGGHSLMATQILSRLRNIANVDIPLRAMYEIPTVANLAEAVEAASRYLLLPTDHSVTIDGTVDWEEGEL